MSFTEHLSTMAGGYTRRLVSPVVEVSIVAVAIHHALFEEQAYDPQLCLGLTRLVFERLDKDGDHVDG